MSNYVVELIVPGPEGTKASRTYSEVTTPTFTADTDGSKDHYLRLTALTTVTLPVATPGASYHIKNDANDVNPCYITVPGGSIEDGVTAAIYFGESFDLYPVNGVWRLF